MSDTDSSSRAGAGADLTADAELERLLAAIDALAAQLEDPDVVEAILARMEEAMRRPAGLRALAARYGGREEAALLRPLTFLLARATAHHGPAAGAAIALDLLERLRCPDDSARSNLATALHLLAMHRAIPSDAPAPLLAAFLGGCLRGGPALRDAAVPALASVLAAGVRFSDEEREALRPAVEALREESPEWAEAALARLHATP